jgi:tRNA1Val (adenine37-N6)-methyltransferase
MENNDAFADPSGGRLKAGLSAAVDDNTGSTPPLKSEETLDTLFGGKLQAFQSRSGYRFSIDAVLLAHFATLKRGEQAIDLGTGNGVIPLLLAYLHPSVRITGVEIQPAMVERAQKNIRLNRCESRTQILPGDVRAIDRVAAPASYDVVVCNPPYRKSVSGRISPNAEKQIARHELKASLIDFLRAGAFLLRAKGRMGLVYPAVRCIDLLDTMRRVGVEPKCLRMVHSFAGREASLVLAEGVKGGRSGVKILAPLVIYQQGKRYTVEVESMLAGARLKPPLD